MSDTLASIPGKLSVPLVLVSDVHLQHMADRRARLLVDVIERLDAQVECLVLNGDIFDFCFGDSPYYQRKFAPLGAALTAAARRGIRVVFIEGNHEFHLTRIGWEGVEFVTERDFQLNLQQGVTIKITHGDLLTDDRFYKIFRTIVKSNLARLTALLIPGGWLDAYTLRHAKLSRAQDKYRKLDHGRILMAFDRWLASGSFDHGIIGHFHVPYAERRPAQEGLMLSVESWDRPNLLLHDGRQFQRVFLREPGEAFVMQPAESIF